MSALTIMPCGRDCIVLGPDVLDPFAVLGISLSSPPAPEGWDKGSQCNKERRLMLMNTTKYLVLLSIMMVLMLLPR